LYGEIQTVIKPLAKVFSDIRGIGGSTTLGDGRIALILDVADLHESLKNLQGIKFDKVNIDTHEGGALG
jgi:chemotaxis protein histidine kinase CheA